MNSFRASATVTYTIDPPEQGMFGKSTSVEASHEIPVRQFVNIDRSKNSAFVPPDFASISADTRGTGYLLTPNISGVAQMQIGSTGELVENTTPYSVVGNQVNAANSLLPSITQTASQADLSGFTPVDSVKQSDGSIGRLKIPSLDVNIKVYDGESLSNMKKGAGHFSSTSCWDGNVAVAAHNRGTNSYFGEIHKLRSGDKIIYETKLGVRTYAVYSVRQVKETDTSCLAASTDNMITLVTCVRDVRENRWCVQAKEV